MHDFKSESTTLNCTDCCPLHRWLFVITLVPICTTFSGCLIIKPLVIDSRRERNVQTEVKSTVYREKFYSFIQHHLHRSQFPTQQNSSDISRFAWPLSYQVLGQWYHVPKLTNQMIWNWFEKQWLTFDWLNMARDIIGLKLDMTTVTQSTIRAVQRKFRVHHVICPGNCLGITNMSWFTKNPWKPESFFTAKLLSLTVTIWKPNNAYHLC